MSRNRSNNKRPTAPDNSKKQKLSETIFSTIRDPSFQRKVGIAVGVLAVGTYFLSQNSGRRRRGQTATDSSGKEAYRGPPPLTKEAVDALYSSAIESLQRKSSQQNTPRGDDDDNAITPEFELFYNKIRRSAPPQQYDPEVRCTIAEFLIVHARFENIARQSASSLPPPLSIEQATSIRAWVEFETNYETTPLSTVANKIDILYRIAMAQKSVSDLRILHSWLDSEQFPKPLTESSHTTDDNFFAIYVQHRFLLACLFGFWDEAATYAVPLDNIILPRSRMKLRQSFTQRAMSRPHAQCNFNQIAVNLDQISERFGVKLRPPVRFETWPIYLLKLRKIVTDEAQLKLNAQLESGMSEWQHFVSGGNLGSNRGSESMVKQVYVFGACVQFISPIQGVAGNLPVTGTWNDSEMYAGMEWTFNAGGSDGHGPPSLANALLVKKRIDMNLERVGHSSNEDIVLEYEIENDETDGVKGWVWSGEMIVDTLQGRPDVFGKVAFETMTNNRYKVVMVLGSRD